VTVAFHGFIAQLFLSAAAMLALTSVVAVVDANIEALVIAPVGVFAGYVGVTALRRARQLIAGPGPTF
jgi:NhaP-type Na+/H+ or K+/H+ antiporter